MSACLTLCVLSKREVPGVYTVCVCVSAGTGKPMSVAHRYDLQGHLIGQNGEGGGRKEEREKLRREVN